MSGEMFEPFVRNAWYLVGWSDELGDEIIGRTIMNENIVLFRDVNSQAVALEDRCCHRGAPLTHGKIVEDGLQCGYHGLVFNAAGKCVKNPGQEKIPPHARVDCYPIVERQHFIWIWMGDPLAADVSKIIDFSYFTQVDQCPSRKGVMEIEANYVMMVDNLMDLSHLGYVHGNTIGGDPESHSNAEMKVVPTETGVKMERWMCDVQPPPTFTKSVEFGGHVDRWQDFEFVAPSTVLQWSGGIDVGKNARNNREQEGFHFRIVHSATPKTENSYYYFFGIGHHHRVGDPNVTEELYQENYATFLEDREIMEAQQVRLEQSPEGPIVPIYSDAAVAQARRALHRLISTERESKPDGSNIST